MQDLEIVVVNFGTNAPIYTEAVFPDPEVRSIAAEKEDQERQRRREARRRAHAERLNANTTTTSRTARRTTRTSATHSSTASTTQPSSRSSNVTSNTASTSGQSSQAQATNSESDFDSDSDSENAPPQDSAEGQAQNNRDNIEEEWITCSIPRNSNEQVQISVHSQQGTAAAPSNNHLTVPQPTRRRIGAKRFRWFSRNIPLANQNRHHPDEDIEECWLSPEPSPQPSPIHSPAVERIAKKWRNKSLPVVLNGCNTCRGDVAIHSHQRPRLIQALFQQVVFVMSILSVIRLY